MPFKSLKNHIGNLATGFVSNQISNFLNSGSAKDSGKVSAQLLKKGPFDIPDSPSQKLEKTHCHLVLCNIHLTLVVTNLVITYYLNQVL